MTSLVASLAALGFLQRLTPQPPANESAIPDQSIALAGSALDETSMVREAYFCRNAPGFRCITRNGG